MNEARDAAVDAYKARSGLLFEVLTEGKPTETQALTLRYAHRLLGKAMEAEVFDPEPRERP